MVVLGFCLGLLAVPALLAPFATTRNGLRLDGIRLPSVCLLRNTTGIPCPGCGLSRSFVDLARGDLAASLHHHRLGLVVVLYLLAQAIRHGGWLVLARARPGIERVGGWLDRSLILLGVALLVNWLVTLAEV